MYVSLRASAVSRLFFFNDTATTEIYTLSLHDALPILKSDLRNLATAEEAFFYDSTKYTTNFALMNNFNPSAGVTMTIRSEEHTSELQSRSELVCRLLLEKTKSRSAIRRETAH